MKFRISFLFALNLLLRISNALHTYHVESFLPTSVTKKLIEDYGGIILTELEFTGRPSFHVMFHQYLPIHSDREKRNWWRSRQRQFKDQSHCPIHKHPAVHLTYQHKLRVSKRGKYNCSDADDFSPFFADLRVSTAKTHGSPHMGTLDKNILKLIHAVRNITNLNDPAVRYAQQYSNDGTGASPHIGFDINVYPAYALGYTGKGVRVVIVDDGVDLDHCDLKDNYDAEISTNLVDAHNPAMDPTPPGDTIAKSESHGTQCAGLVAAIANNSRCSHGVAYEAKVGGVRVLGGSVTDVMEAQAFSHRWEKVDIYCASWGPTDDGMTMDIPREKTMSSIRQAWSQGREGKGAIYVFASGNGGGVEDNCGADGFIGRPEIISIGALDEMGTKAVYAESCSSLRCSVPVGGLQQHGDILPSTSPNNKCLMDFAGTSAAAPLAAGCFALALQANPNLKQRDLEHLIPWSTRLPSTKNQDWYMNAAGLMHSVHVGFGLLDCTRMVMLAQNWSSVGPLCVARIGRGRIVKEDWTRRQARVPSNNHFPAVHSTIRAARYLNKYREKNGRFFANLSTKYETELQLKVVSLNGSLNGDVLGDLCHVEVLEKVVVHVQWEQLCRGITTIWLQSPAGTQTTLLAPRPHDQYNGPSNMTFTSVAQMGEQIEGTWIVGFDLDGNCSNKVVQNLTDDLRGAVNHVDLEFWGTSKRESGYARNAKMLNVLLTEEGRKARESKKGWRMEDHEVSSVFHQQRDMAYNFTKRAIEEKYPNLRLDE